MKKIVLLTAAFMCFFVTMAQETLHITFSDGKTTTHVKTEYVVILSPTSWNVPAFLRLPSSEEYLVYDNSYYLENHQNAVEDYQNLKSMIENSYSPHAVKEIATKNPKGQLGYDVGI